MQIHWNRIIRDFVSLIFPAICRLCRGPLTGAEGMICSSCVLRLPRENNGDGRDNPTAHRLLGLFPFLQAYSFLKFSKGGLVQKLLHQIKYHRNPQLAYTAGIWMAHEILSDIGSRVDLIIPVPLHPHKISKRGFNQSERIARGLSAVTSVPVCCALERMDRSPSQTALSRWHRFENTESEFRLAPGFDPAGHRVLLIDDVITTGATVSGCALPLMRKGVDHISLAALALSQDQ